MWAFRKEAHKIGGYLKEEDPSVPCTDNIGLKIGSQGVYFIDVDLGMDIGEVSVDFDASDIPDRFNLVWDDNIVADSKYVGDDINGTPSFYPGLLGTFNNVIEYNYTGPIPIPTGQIFNITVNQNDIADGSQEEPTDGNITLSFIKSTPTPTNMRIVVYGVLGGTLFTANVSCPQSILTEPISIGSASSSGLSCRDFYNSKNLFYIDPSSNFLSTNNIYTDAFATQLAQPSFFSDGQFIREWDGTAFVATAQSACTVIPVFVRIGSSAVNACQNSVSELFIPINSNFSTATEIYTSANATNFAFPGFYSDGNLWRQWNGSNFTNSGTC